MEYSGALLKSVREKKNLSLGDVNRYTKIPKDILANIESDRISAVNPAYLKGYLKIYTKYLGLNTTVILGAYKNVFPKDERPVLVPARTDEDGKEIDLPQLNFTVILNVLVVLALLIASVVFIRHYLGKRKIKPAPVKHAATASPPIKKAVVLSKKKEGLSKKEQSVQKEQLSKQKNVAPPEKLKFSQSEGLKLAIHAKDNAYLRVKADNISMFSGTLKKGQTEIWSAKDNFELFINNAANVDLEVNGSPVQQLSKKKQAINNMLINRDGIQIK